MEEGTEDELKKYKTMWKDLKAHIDKAVADARIFRVPQDVVYERLQRKMEDMEAKE